MIDNYRNKNRKYEQEKYQDFGIPKSAKLQISNNNNKPKSINQNNYIKIDLNKYRNNTYREHKIPNSFTNSKKVETVSIDINSLQKSALVNNYMNRNLNKINNKKRSKPNKKSEIKYKKLKLYRDEETGSLSTGVENMHNINKSNDIRSQIYNTKEEKFLKMDLNYINTKRNNINNNNSSQSKSFDVSSKKTVNSEFNRKIYNNYGLINKTSNNILTDPNDEARKNYNKKINMDKINKINKIELIFNNKDIKKEKLNENKKHNVMNNKQNKYQNAYDNKYDLNIEEKKENKNKDIQNYLKDNKEILNVKKSEVFSIEKNSEVFSSQKDNNDNNNLLSYSNDSIVEEKLAYDKNSFKSKNYDININIEYLNKYLKNNNNIINKNENTNNNYSIKENTLNINNANANNNEGNNFGKIEDNVDFRVSLIKPNINTNQVEYKNEGNISKNFSFGSSKIENNMKNKEDLISNKSSSIKPKYTNNTINNINDSDTNKNQNYNKINQKLNNKVFNTAEINNTPNNIDITLKKKDSLNDNQMEESSHYNMNFYDSRVININGRNSNSNINSNNTSSKNIYITDRNNKIEIPLDKNNSSLNNSNNYNNYYNSFINSNMDMNESKNIKNEKEFINLKPNKAFKKFLTSKIKYYMNEDSIPKKFISEFIGIKAKKHRKAKNINDDKDSNNFGSNYKDKNNINIFGEDYSEFFESNKNFLYYGGSGRKINYDNYNNIDNKYHNERKLLKEQYEIKKSLLLDQNKELLNKINKLQQFIDDSKNQMEERDKKIKVYLSTYDKISSENEQNKKKIENLEYELHAKNNEVEEKQKKIYELNNLNSNLEDKMNILKKEYVNEAISNKETKENYVMIKNNYNDIKNQYDLLNIKYQTLSDENYNFRRDKLLYEKELKTKNLMIEDLLQSNSSLKKNELKVRINKFKLNKIEEEENEKYFKTQENEDEINNKNNTKEKEEKGEIVINRAPVEDAHKFDELGLDELMSKRNEMLRDRKNTTNEYYKIPNKANSAQIKKRNELEVKLDQINNDLAKIRIRINILKYSKYY